VAEPARNRNARIVAISRGYIAWSNERDVEGQGSHEQQRRRRRRRKALIG
jgi:hypothetical protein